MIKSLLNTYSNTVCLLYGKTLHLCYGLNLVLVQNFSNWFNFHFLLSCIYYHNLKQWQIKLQPVQKFKPQQIHVFYTNTTKFLSNHELHSNFIELLYLTWAKIKKITSKAIKMSCKETQSLPYFLILSEVHDGMVSKVPPTTHFLYLFHLKPIG